MKSLAVVRWSAIGIAVAIALGALCRQDAIIKVGPPSVAVTEPTGVKIEKGGIPITVSLGTGWGATALLALLAAWRWWKYRLATDHMLVENEPYLSKMQKSNMRAKAVECGIEKYINARVRALGLAKGTKHQ